MPNRLSHETSPYLLQHANNPVDWYPWGDEALDRARQEDRPILLSIGYSACHWCHVMEHESFENPQTAALMNEEFVSIKVDREERPDLDAIYMQAVQAMTGRGGWPMTVFLSPDGIPFYGGTYYPPEDRLGMPGFPRVLRAVADAYRTRREEVIRSGSELLENLRRNEALQVSTDPLQDAILGQAFTALARQFDANNGGFGGAPKFPQPMALEFLLRYFHRFREPRALIMVETTLSRMAEGGVYDQLGGGFHRYSTDAHWLIPHFEKMLYDNAQLARLYLSASQVTGNPTYRRIAEETLDYVLREMTSDAGGFYSTQDADSEGEEGKFFAWTLDQVRDALGDEACAVFCMRYGVEPYGSFEGKNVLHVDASVEKAAGIAEIDPATAEALIEESRRRLYALREQRVHPGLDDKIVTSWNGLMLRAFAEASRALDREDYRAAAVRNAEFLLAHLWQDGRLLRTRRLEQSKGAAYLEDYACLANGLLSLYEATFDERWFAWARELAQLMIEQFADGAGGFFDAASDYSKLVLRPKELYDNAMPSGNSAASEALLRLAAFTGDETYRRSGLSVLQLLLPAGARYPTAFGHALCAADLALSTPIEVAIVGLPADPRTERLIHTVFTPYLPNKVVAGAESADDQAARTVPLLAGRTAAADGPLAYVCEHFACRLPVSEPTALAAQLGVSVA